MKFKKNKIRIAFDVLSVDSVWWDERECILHCKLFLCFILAATPSLLKRLGVCTPPFKYVPGCNFSFEISFEVLLLCSNFWLLFFSTWKGKKSEGIEHPKNGSTSKGNGSKFIPWYENWKN